ncbi:MAG TPA: glycosyltransferase family 4 protein [Candidatus Thermoplasmatota archaeon]|jgi:glycosyltransferase involved in cell wall biosynthesis|nr:glycosyltransferase family 4 protein [Candidatus Thermoplasmatota archaeon]
MRVTLVSPFDPTPPGFDHVGAHVGGVERVLHRLAHELAARGHEATLLCSTAGRSRVSYDGPVRVLRVRRAGTVLRTPVTLLDRHLPRDADLVHVAGTYPMTTERVLRAAHRQGKPCVLDFHFEPHPEGVAGRAAAKLYRAVGPRAFPLAQAVVVRSEAYARSAPSLQRVPPERWHVVPNGVDGRYFHPSARVGEGDHLLVVGRLVPYKGVEVLLRALALLPGAPPLVVVGDGPLRSRLEALAGKLGVDARFAGRVPDANLRALYQRARLTVLPSVNGQEAFGVVLLESMACGTPVVATSLPGVAELAARGGVLAEPGDPASLAAAVSAALQPGRLPRGEALAARTRKYAWPAVTDRLLQVYADVLRGTSAGEALEVPQLAHPQRQPVP